ncbi:MAG: FAD-dependent oxidoreductase [Kiritimatiellaeota bacterium]|nr:FAD-dependent oxidoreductase [Kiritimatiellota bacterium]
MNPSPNVLRREESPHRIRVDSSRTHVAEAPRRTPVAADADVLVVGGGPSGVAAALSAARGGARTVLIERHGLLGGMWTAGLVNPIFDFRKKGWIVAELIDRLESSGAWRPHPRRATFNVEAMVRLLEAMMIEAGVSFQYHVPGVDAIVESGVVRGVIAESKAGREAFLAKVVIDCTGDGDVAARAGAPYELGRPQDGLMQPMTLMFEIEGVGDYEQQKTADTYDQLIEIIRRQQLDIELPFGRVNYAPAIILMPQPGRAAVQATHVYRLNGIDPRAVTRGMVEARKQVADLMRLLPHIPGLENVRLSRTAAALGVRETRRICGRYRLTLEDLKVGRRFDDAVTFCTFGVDIHEPAPGAGVPTGHGARIRPYEIPYRCLLPTGLGGILVAGRCISGSHEAHASYRVTGTCMGMGQAAGFAAAWAVSENATPSELPGPELRQRLAERGVGFLGENRP